MFILQPRKLLHLSPLLFVPRMEAAFGEICFCNALASFAKTTARQGRGRSTKAPGFNRSAIDNAKTLLLSRSRYMGRAW